MTTAEGFAASTSPVSIERLAMRAAEGDTSALSELFKQHYTSINSYVTRRVQTKQIAQDITGEVWLRVTRSIHTYISQGEGYFARWLRTIARNVIYTRYRDNQRRPDLASDMLLLSRPCTDAGPEEIAERHERAVQVVRALQTLTSKQRECLVLRYYDGLSEAETAAVMGHTLGSVKLLQYRAMRSMRRHLSVSVLASAFDDSTTSTAPAGEQHRTTR